MKKDKEIWLEPEEIQQLLEGGLYWKDIESKLSQENADSFKRHISVERDMDDDSTFARDSIFSEPVEEKDVRAILLGEDKTYELEKADEQAVIDEPQEEVIEEHEKLFSIESIPEAQGLDDMVPEEEDMILKERTDTDRSELNLFQERPIVKDRQINFSRAEEELQFAFVSETAASNDEPPSLEETMEDPILTQTIDNEFKDFLTSEPEEEEEKRTPFGGLKLILLLVIAIGLTFGFWTYFVGR